MERDEEEQNHPGDSLNQIEPVARIRIIKIVGTGFHRDHEPIHRMVNQRNENSAYLDEENIGNRLEVFDGVVEVGRAIQGFRVCIKVLE